MKLRFNTARPGARQTVALAHGRRTARAIGFALLTAGLPGWAMAQSLTLQTALREAEMHSRALPAQDAASRSAREMAVAAGQLPDPVLGVSVDNLPLNGPMQFSLGDDFMTMRSIGLSQTLTRKDKRQARAARFEREADAAQAARVMQLAVLRRNTALAWFDRYYQQQMLELLVRQRAEASLQIESAEAAFRAGRGAQADIFMARSAVAGIEDRIQAAQTRLANATTSLARWVGDSASAPLGDRPQISQTRLSEDDAAQNIARHPAIALLASQEVVAEAEAEVARQEKHADWSVSLSFSQRGSAYFNMASIGVSIPLQWDQKNRQDRELAARLAKVEQARAEREEMVRERLAQTRQWLASWRSGLDRLDDYDATLIPLVAERTQAALAAYRGGKGSLPDVLEARRAEIETRIERLGIEMETAAVWAELEFLIPETGIAVPQATATNTMQEGQQ